MAAPSLSRTFQSSIAGQETGASVTKRPGRSGPPLQLSRVLDGADYGLGFVEGLLVF